MLWHEVHFVLNSMPCPMSFYYSALFCVLLTSEKCTGEILYTDLLRDKSLPSFSYQALLGTQAAELEVAAEEQMGCEK